MKLKNLLIVALGVSTLCADSSNVTSLTNTKEALHFLILDYHKLQEKNKTYDVKIENARKDVVNLQKKNIELSEKLKVIISSNTQLKDEWQKYKNDLSVKVKKESLVKKPLVLNQFKNSTTSQNAGRDIQNESMYDDVINKYLEEKSEK